MQTHNRLNKTASDITDDSGWYGVRAAGRTIPVYIDQEYDGGGWVCVMANRAQTGGMNKLKHFQAINECHFRTGASNTTGSNVRLDGPKKGKTQLADINLWVGLKFWADLAGRDTPDKITVVQFVAEENGAALSSSHTKRWRWQFDGFTEDYGFDNAVSVGGEADTTDAPGMFSYHAQNSYAFSTFDTEQDINYSALYNNNPFWYSGGWSGNYFAGGDHHLDKPYWLGSGDDHHQYGAIYIK